MVQGLEQLTRNLPVVDQSKSKNKSFTKRFGAESVQGFPLPSVLIRPPKASLALLNRRGFTYGCYKGLRIRERLSKPDFPNFLGNKTISSSGRSRSTTPQRIMQVPIYRIKMQVKQNNNMDSHFSLINIEAFILLTCHGYSQVLKAVRQTCTFSKWRKLNTMVYSYKTAFSFSSNTTSVNKHSKSGKKIFGQGDKSKKI